MGTLWLIGMMGAGKTTIGALAARRLQIEAVDTDRLVEERTGSSVPGLFAEGEQRFRQAERRAVEAVAGAAAVVSCGGGVVTDPELVALLRSSGLVVWLDAPVGMLAERVDGGGRPLLSDDPDVAMGRLLDERRALYEGAAHVVVDASGSPDEVTEAVVQAWTSWS